MNYKTNIIEVAAAVIRDAGNILICSRPSGSHMEGYMEFPGGKLEKDETFPVCLRREIREELGAEIRVLDCLYVLTHDYGGKVVRVFFYRAQFLPDSPPPAPKEKQLLKWIPVSDLNRENMLPADRSLANFLIRAGVTD